MPHAHDGRLLNIKSSDFAKYQSTSHATGNNVSPKIIYRLLHATTSNIFYGSGFLSSQGRGFSKTHGPNGHRFTNANDNGYTGNPGVTANNPLPMIFGSTTARPRTNATGSAPSITTASMPINAPEATVSGRGSTTPNSNLKWSELAGISASSIPTDVCDNARGLANSPGNQTTVHSPKGEAGGGGTFVLSKGSGNNEYSSYYGTTNDNIAYTVVHTMATNTWIEVKLNTIAAAGDMVVVYVCSAGGDMYTHSIDPIYLRSPTGGSHSGATIGTYLAPNKNTTATDTNNAGYYAIVGSGGNVGRVGFNPYRSTGNYVPTIAHILVIKKGNGNLIGPATANGYTHLKYGGQNSGIPQENSSYITYARQGGTYLSGSHGGMSQAFNITIATAPFAAIFANYGKWSSTNSSHSGAGVEWDMAWCGSGFFGTKGSGGGSYGHQGQWSVTVDNYTGYHYFATGKYGTIVYGGSGTSNYNPQPTWGFLNVDYVVHAFTVFRG